MTPARLLYHPTHVTVSLLLLTTLPGLVPPSRALTLPQLSQDWHLWKTEHGKGYGSVKEELYRHVVWQSNLRFIEAHNAFNKTFGYTLAMNEMGDLVRIVMATLDQRLLLLSERLDL